MTASKSPSEPVHVVGGGLAGSEAAWQIASRAFRWCCTRCARHRMTDAHNTDGLAELVCSNSFRSDDAANNAVGLLHEEMRRLGSLIMRAADANQVPAGGALAVDRDGFSAAVTAALERHPLIEIERAEVAGLPPADWDNVIVATGPLTSPALADAIRTLTGEDALAFFDAIAPIVHREFDRYVGRLVPVALRQGGPRRHRRRLHQLPADRGAIRRLRRCAACRRQDRLPRMGSNTPYFDGCLPIEVMAERGRETLRHGPMKPVGLTNPHDPT